MADVMNPRTAIQAAKLTSIPVAFVLAGYGYCASHNSVPQLYDKSPSISTPIFTQVYRVGAGVVVPGAALSAAASAYLAYAIPAQRALWAVASASTIGALPFTAIVMMPGIKRLIAMSESSAEQENTARTGEHVELLKKWAAQNYVRGSLFLMGAMIGLVAVVGL